MPRLPREKKKQIKNSMRKLDIKKIPEKIVLEKELSQAVGELNQSVRQIHDAVERLKEVQDFTLPTTADPNAWSESLKDADKRKDEALKAIEADLALPTNSKQKLAQDWKNLHKTVAIKIPIVNFNGRTTQSNQPPQYWKSQKQKPCGTYLKKQKTTHCYLQSYSMPSVVCVDGSRSTE